MSFLIIATGWGARIVLGLLAALSVWSIAIMIDRKRAMKSVGSSRDADEAKRLIQGGQWAELEAWARKGDSLHAGAMLRAIETGREPARVDRAVRGYLTERRTTLERGLTVLATLGSNAPFLGLFGTVLGIIQAFGVLAAQPSGSSMVMLSLAEALIATAVGLLVAMPAVVAFNFFSRRLKSTINECEALRDFYLAKG